MRKTQISLAGVLAVSLGAMLMMTPRPRAADALMCNLSGTIHRPRPACLPRLTPTCSRSRGMATRAIRCGRVWPSSVARRRFRISG